MKKYLLLLWILCVSALAQVSVIQYSSPVVQFLDSSGNPLAGGKLYTCSAGLTCPGNPLATYKDLGVTANSNPIILDSGGFAVIYLKQGSSYKFLLQNSSGVQQPNYPQDNITAVSQIISNPAGNASQTIAGPLNLGAFGLTAGNGTFSGTILCRILESIRCVDAANTGAWAGTDITAQINSAYADLPVTSPPSVGLIYVFPAASGCYSATTPLAFTTLNKYVRVKAMGNACINFTPTSGAFATLDYMNAAGSAFPPDSGFEGLTVINNGCLTSGGCGSTAVAFACGNANGGMYGASMTHNGIYGFGTVWSCSNVATVGVHWDQDIVTANGGVFKLGNINGTHIVGGIYNGNGAMLTQLAASASELYIEGGATLFNAGALFDYTASNSSNVSTLQISNTHLETFGGTNGNGCRFVTGFVNVNIRGGIMEDDSSTGTCDAFFATQGSYLYIDGLQTTANRAITQVALLVSPTRARITTIPLSSNVYTIAGGANAAFATIKTLKGGSANAAATEINESTISAPAYQVAGVPTIYNVAADFTTANNTNLQTITGLTWTLPASTALTVPFSCHLLYSQATAAVADQFGIQSATIAPTNISAKAQAYTSASAFTAGNLPTLSTTTATPIVTFTPSAITTVWNADIDGVIQNPSNASPNVINIMAQTSNGADAITIKKDGSFCRVF